MPELRPQGVLGVVVPLAWAAGARLGAPNRSRRADGGDLWSYIVLTSAAAVAANTHLLAPDVAAVLRPLQAAAVIVVGLLLVPWFPDSAAALDAYRLASDSPAVPAVIGSADLAVLPARHVVDARLARAGGWRRLATVPVIAPIGGGDTAVVWLTDRWAARWVRAGAP